MNMVLKILLIVLALAVLLFGLLLLLVYRWEVTIPKPKDYDSIIVLGAQVKSDGVPSVQLQARLDTAAEYYRQKPVPVVCCGAQGSNEPRPEGDVMRDVLIASGVSGEQAISEPNSYTTRQNLENAKAILEKMGCRKPLIVTSDYHVKRAMALAEDIGMDVEGAGSPCRSEPSFWLKNHCREAVAWIKYWAEKCLGRTL